TARHGALADFFQQQNDPTVDQPVFGDTADEIREAQSRGKLYLAARVDASRVTYGSFAAAVGSPGDLLRYERTLSGLDVDLRRDFGAFGQRARLFAARRDDRVARAVDLFRATGGALYYLRHD